MKPYITTVEHLLPGMAVRAVDVEEGGTAVVRVVHTYMHEDGTAVIGGDMLSVDVKHDSEITVLHNPTQDDQEVWISANMPWDDNMTEIVRRNAEQAMAYHKNRGRHDG